MWALSYKCQAQKRTGIGRAFGKFWCWGVIHTAGSLQPSFHSRTPSVPTCLWQHQGEGDVATWEKSFLSVSHSTEENESGEKGNCKEPPLVLVEQPGCGLIRAAFRKGQELAFFPLLTTSLQRNHCGFDLSASELKKRSLWCWYRCSIHGYLPHQDNLSFLPVIPIELTTPLNNGKQVLKLSTGISLAEFNVKHTIKCLAETRCKHSWLTWGHSKGCRSSWRKIKTTEQISLLQTALGSALFLLSTKQSIAQSRFTAAFQRRED